MKRLLVAMMLLVSANAVSEQSAWEDKVDLCFETADMANILMGYRYDGKSKEELIAMFDFEQGTMYHSVLVMTYEYPLPEDEGDRQVAAEYFSTYIQKECIIEAYNWMRKQK